MNKKTMHFWHIFFSFIYEKRKHGNATFSKEIEVCKELNYFCLNQSTSARARGVEIAWEEDSAVISRIEQKFSDYL